MRAPEPANPRAIVGRRLVLVALLTLLLCSSGAAVRAQVVDAEDDFVARIAQARAAQGLRTFAVAADLQVGARRHAQRMADKGTYFHNPNIGSEVQNWSRIAENVGKGPNVEDLHQAFMASSQHRAAILNTDLTQIGVGVVRGADGMLYVVQVFRQPMAAAPSPPPTTAPPPPTTALPVTVAPAPPPTAPTAPPPSSAPTTSTPGVALPAVTLPPSTAPPSPLAIPGEVAAQAALEVDLLRATPDRPAAVAPALGELAATVPAAAWVGAFLLAAVVGLQGQVLRRLGLVS